MKINPGWRPLGSDVKISDNASSQQIMAKSFSDAMRQQEKQSSREELQRKLKEIHQQGERLAKSMTVRELRQYKQLVKRFLDETVRRGVGLKETRGWDRRGRTKRYKLLEEIDGHLLEMADELLQSEQGRIEILHKVGEIRGMLMNLLF